MFVNTSFGLSAFLDLLGSDAWFLLENPVCILFKLYLYLYFVSQVKGYIYQFWEGEATHQRDVLTP